MSESARPKSTVAQIVAAVAAVAVVIFLVIGSYVFVEIVDQSITVTSVPSAAKQWVCLPYTEYVLEQHRAGLTPEQIQATLVVSELDRGSQPGVTTPTVDIDEPRLDSIDACGLPSEIIAAAAK